MEFFERGAFYGMMSILSVYLTDQLLFSKESVGVLKGVVQALVFFLPIVAGALSERFGYRRTLIFALICMGAGYFLTSRASGYAAVFVSLIVMAVGAGAFKPVISGTIARETDASTSSVGFGIYYWTVNLGAFLFPLILVPFVKNAFGWRHVMTASAVAAAVMLVPALWIYREPKKPAGTRRLAAVLKGMVLVLRDLRFIGLIVVYSGFWILYFQLFDSVLWYLQKYVDPSSLDRVVNAALRTVGIGGTWRFDVEHVTAISAGTIILCQLAVSKIVHKAPPLPTMIAGVGLGTAGMAILAISSNIWVFLAGIMIFAIGEMTAHPKFLSYVGRIAPEDKKALYLGYAFLYGVIGSSLGSVLGARLYVHFVDRLDRPAILWLVFSAIGAATMLGLLLYNRFLSPRPGTPS